MKYGAGLCVFAREFKMGRCAYNLKNAPAERPKRWYVPQTDTSLWAHPHFPSAWTPHSTFVGWSSHSLEGKFRPNTSLLPISPSCVPSAWNQLKHFSGCITPGRASFQKRSDWSNFEY